jgi:hypothetical protein
MANEQDAGRQDAAAGGQEIGVTEARGGQRVGLIWVLVISLGLAVVGLLGYSTLNSGHMNTATGAAGSKAAPVVDAPVSAPVSNTATP